MRLLGQFQTFYIKKNLYEKILHIPKHPKHQNHKKHKKHKNATKQKYKTLQANKNKKCA